MSYSESHNVLEDAVLLRGRCSSSLEEDEAAAAATTTTEKKTMRRRRREVVVLSGEEEEDEEQQRKLSKSDLRQVELLGRSLSSNKLEESPIEGSVLVLARIRDRVTNVTNLSWRQAFFAVSNGGVLRIFRSVEDRSKWAELAHLAENLAKWRSAISDAHVVSCLRDLPENEASMCRRIGRRRTYCGATRARCAALGPTPIERDEDERSDGDDENDERDDDTDSTCSSGASFVIPRSNSDPDRASLIQGGCYQTQSSYATFEVWLRSDIANPNAKPVLKFAGSRNHSDVLALHHALLTCSQHFHGPKQAHTFLIGGNHHQSRPNSFHHHQSSFITSQ